MFTLTALFLVTLIVVGIALFIISIGGTFFILIGGDLIIAIFVIWFIFFRKRHGKKGTK